MAPVTVRSTSNVAQSSGNTGWSARSLFCEPVPEIATNIVGTATSNGSFGVTSSVRCAQSFTPDSSFSLAYIEVLFNLFSSPGDSFFVEVHTDNSNEPSGSVVTNGTSIVYNASALTTTNVQFKIEWTTPPSLSSGTKYWLVFVRNGSPSGVNGYTMLRSAASIYSSGDFSVHNGSAWALNGSSDLIFAMYASNAATAVYAVVQDTALHVYKSTDNAASFSELDSANAPAVNSATKPFSALHTPFGGLIVEYFSGTNTTRQRQFNIPLNTWSANDLQSADSSTDSDFNRNVRALHVPVQRSYNLHTSLADDADLRYTNRTNGAWSAEANLLAITNADASSFLDAVFSPRSSSFFVTMLWQDATAGDVMVQTLNGTTAGTATALDASASDIEAEHASGTFDVYWNGTNSRIIAAFIDADGTLEERILTLGVTAASISQATQHQVSASTSYLGRQLSSCVSGGDAYIFACTGTGIDVFKDTGIAGTWAAAVNWKSGLTNCFLGAAVPIPGYGIAVIYNDNGTTKVDTFAVHATGTVATGTHAVAGQAVSATTGSVASVSTGTHAVSGQAITGTSATNATGTVGTGTHAVSGQTITATTDAAGTVGTGSLAVSGQVIAATTGVVATVSTGALAVTGQTITGAIGDTGTIGTGSHAVNGQTVSATAGVVVTIATGNHAVTGQTVTGTPTVAGNVTSDSYAVTSQPVTATTGVAAQVATGSHAIAGQPVTSATGTVASVTTGAHTVTGQPISATTGTVADVATGSLSVTGQTVIVDDGGNDETGAVATGSLAVSGQAVSATYNSTGNVATGSLSVTGQEVAATTGAVATLTTGSLSVNGQSIASTVSDTGQVSTGSYSIIGQDIAGQADWTAFIMTGVLSVEGQSFTATDGIVADPDGILTWANTWRPPVDRLSAPRFAKQHERLSRRERRPLR